MATAKLRAKNEIEEKLIIAIFGDGYGEGLPDEPAGFYWTSGKYTDCPQAKDKRGFVFSLVAIYDDPDWQTIA